MLKDCVKTLPIEDLIAQLEIRMHILIHHEKNELPPLPPEVQHDPMDIGRNERVKEVAEEERAMLEAEITLRAKKSDLRQKIEGVLNELQKLAEEAQALMGPED